MVTHTAPSRPKDRGAQRDWVWRGWQTRYSVLHPLTPSDDPPILCVHGFGAAIGHWQHNLPVLSQRHRVYALDLLGFGASEKAAENYVTALRADQIYDFWRTFIGEPVILVGNSLGSLASLVTAARYPEMVAGLAMINLPDASVMNQPAWMQTVLSGIKAGLFPLMWVTKQLFTSPLVFKPFFWLISRPRSIRFWVSQAYVDQAAVTDELVEMLVQPTCDRNAANALLAMFNAKEAPQDPAYTAKAILPTLDIPILLLWGRQDKLVPPTLAPLFVQANPQIELIELDPAGHCPQDECPTVVNTAILNWMGHHWPSQS